MNCAHNIATLFGRGRSTHLEAVQVVLCRRMLVRCKKRTNLRFEWSWLCEKDATTAEVSPLARLMEVPLIRTNARVGGTGQPPPLYVMYKSLYASGCATQMMTCLSQFARQRVNCG